MNVTEANLVGQPDWKLEYSAAAAYQLPDLSATSWHALAERFGTGKPGDIELLFAYIDRQSALAGTPTKKCGEICRRGIVCEVLSTSASELAKCAL